MANITQGRGGSPALSTNEGKVQCTSNGLWQPWHGGDDSTATKSLSSGSLSISAPDADTTLDTAGGQAGVSGTESTQTVSGSIEKSDAPGASEAPSSESPSTTLSGGASEAPSEAPSETPSEPVRAEPASDTEPSATGSDLLQVSSASRVVVPSVVLTVLTITHTITTLVTSTISA